MNKTYSAIYYNFSGRFYNAFIFLSSITLSIRYTDENNEIKDVYWLAENILSFDEEALASVLLHKSKDGQTERLVIRDPELVQAINKILAITVLLVDGNIMCLGKQGIKSSYFFQF